MTTPLFRFSTTSYPVGDLEVTSFVGNERISRLFRYVIELRSSISVDVDTAAILDEPARFEFVRDSLSIPVHGVLSAFNYLRSDARYHYYQAVLVPQLWTESLSQSSQIYKRQTIVQIIETELESAGLVKGRDFIVDVAGDYPEKEYVCQFKESNFDFVSRLMEFHGIYYYFVHTADISQMVICDHGNYYGLADSYPEFGAGSDIAFAQNPSRESTYTSIWSLAQSNNRTADAVAIRDYDESQPSLAVEAAEGSRTRLTLHLAGENVIDPDQAATLAQIRLQEVNTERQVYDGTSGVIALAPGHSFALQSHPRGRMNRAYLVVGVIHKGRVPDLTVGETGSTAPVYENEFRAIGDDVLFRPRQVTPRPYFTGTQLGTIYAEQNDPWTAEIDPQGRYRVRLFFVDATTKEEASCWMRMAQPGAGANDNFFLPLKPDTEVLIGFINGNPDLPVIQGALSNSQFPAPVTATNPHHGLIATSGLLALRSGGGFNLNVKTTNDTIRDSDSDFRFPRLDLASRSYQELLDGAGEMSGEYLVERAYGDEYEFRYGNSFRYLTNESEYVMGSGYLEQHAVDAAGAFLDIDAISTATRLNSWNFPSPYDRSSAQGLAEKTWGDEFDYHNGTLYTWSDCAASPNGGGRTINYGAGYEENIYNANSGSLSDAEEETHTPLSGVSEVAQNINIALAQVFRPDVRTSIQTAVEAGNASSDNTYDYITKTAGDTYDYHNGNELNVHIGETIEVVYGDSKSIVQGSSFEHHNGDSAWFFNGGHDDFVMGRSTSTHLGYKADTFVGGILEVTVAGKIELEFSGGFSGRFGPIATVNFGEFDLRTNKMEVKLNEIEATATRIENTLIGIKSNTTRINNCISDLRSVVTQVKSGGIDIDTNGLKVIS